MNQIKICPNCKTNNPASAAFCQACGTSIESQPVYSVPEDAPLYGQPNFTPNSDRTFEFSTETGEKISGEEMYRIMGKNGDKYLEKMAKSELSGASVGWCWHVFWLSFVFGPIGAALWFIYRKMYRFGIILLAIGLLFDGLTTATSISIDPSVLKEMTSIADLANLVAEVQTPLSVAVSSLSNLVELASAILLPMFAVHIYKNHCKKTILKIRHTATDPVHTNILYDAWGGTSGGALAAAIVVSIFVSNTATILGALINL